MVTTPVLTNSVVCLSVHIANVTTPALNHPNQPPIRNLSNPLHLYIPGMMLRLPFSSMIISKCSSSPLSLSSRLFLLATVRNMGQGKKWPKLHKSAFIGKHEPSDFDVFGDPKKDHTVSPNPNKDYTRKKQGFKGWGPRKVNIKLIELRKERSPNKLFKVISEKSQDFHALNVTTAWVSLCGMPNWQYPEMLENEHFKKFLAETTIRMNDHPDFFGKSPPSYATILHSCARLGVHINDARCIIDIVKEKGEWILKEGSSEAIGMTSVGFAR